MNGRHVLLKISDVVTSDSFITNLKLANVQQVQDLESFENKTTGNESPTTNTTTNVTGTTNNKVLKTTTKKTGINIVPKNTKSIDPKNVTVSNQTGAPYSNNPNYNNNAFQTITKDPSSFNVSGEVRRKLAIDNFRIKRSIK